jgi:hypothetical protein
MKIDVDDFFGEKIDVDEFFEEEEPKYEPGDVHDPLRAFLGGKISKEDLLEEIRNPPERPPSPVIEPGLEEPWVPNPLEMIAGVAGAARKMGMSVGRSLLSGILGAGAEFPIGAATEEIEQKDPRFALPFNLGMGILSGMTAERAVERGFMRLVGPKAAKPKVSELLRKQFTKRFVPGIKPEDIVPQQLRQQ